jgi:hypothetical protein
LPDPTKYGWSSEDLMADLAALDQLQSIQIRGLMTIAPLGLTDSELLNLFAQTAQLAATIQSRHWFHIQMQELSMGMSGDYKLAVQAGATMIRVGRSVFGDRPL